jgi:catalase
VQGIKNFYREEAEEMTKKDPDYAIRYSYLLK